MAATILDAIQNLATPEMIKTATSALGVSDQSATMALAASATSLLGGLMQQQGNAGLLDKVVALAGAVKPDANLFANLGGIFTGGLPVSPTHALGNRFLGVLFGDRLAGAIAAVAAATGISGKAANGLMSLAAPMVLAALRNHLGGALSVAGLLKMLAADRGAIASATLPALRGVYGLNGAIVGTPSVAATLAPAAAAAHARSATGPAQIDDGRSDIGAWIGMLLLAGLVTGAVWYLAYGSKPSPVPEKAAIAAPAAPATPKKAEPAKKETVALVAVPGPDGLMTYTLPGGKKIDVAKDGLEAKMLDLIVGKETIDHKKWFDFDRLGFESASTDLDAKSAAQVSTVADILKAFPGVAVKIGGYSDNEGDPEANKKLSAERAARVRDEIVKAGVAASRIESEGYGDQYAVGDNATEEGRAKNRRTALSVRAK